MAYSILDPVAIFEILSGYFLSLSWSQFYGPNLTASVNFSFVVWQAELKIKLLMGKTESHDT